jgi:hypothetical protein
MSKDENKKKAGNPLWKVGVSGNPQGKRKHSARTVTGMIQRLINRHYSPTKMNKIIEGLTAQQKAEMYLKLLPFIAAPKRAEDLSDEMMDRILKYHEALKQQANEEAGQKKAG